jgi:hypothetical protein
LRREFLNMAYFGEGSLNIYLHNLILKHFLIKINFFQLLNGIFKNILKIFQVK